MCVKMYESMMTRTVVTIVAGLVIFVYVVLVPARSEGFVKALIGPVIGLAAPFAAKPVANLVDKKINQPRYNGREWNGWDWSCPYHDLDTGSADNSKACIASDYHPEVAGKCLAGSTPTGESAANMKCRVGFMNRVLAEGKWQCPWGTEDTGNDWSNKPWAEAQQQCKITRPYTLRMNIDNNWQCPPGTTDTGKTWGQPNEWDQCKFKGGMP